MAGYRAKLDATEDIVVMALDSATPGRLAITFYRELKASEFLERVEAWHTLCAWPQNFGKDIKFIGAPAPRDIAEAAYGRRLDDELRKATVERLLPCIVDGLPVPRDLVESATRRASNRASLEQWEWEKCLGIACALYKGYHTERNYREVGQSIFVQSDDRKVDGETSLRNRAESEKNGIGKNAFKKGANKDETAKKACAKWFDVRAFGQVFAFGKEADADGVSIPIRGPVTVQSAFSKEPVSITSTQITKSVSGEGDGSKRGSDTMGMKHPVDQGIYECYGSINPQLAERTGFRDNDAEVIKAVLPKLFENDASSARPEGSMEVLNVIWWNHNCKSGQHSTAKVHRSLTVNPDGSIELCQLDGLKSEVYG